MTRLFNSNCSYIPHLNSHIPLSNVPVSQKVLTGMFLCVHCMLVCVYHVCASSATR